MICEKSRHGYRIHVGHDECDTVLQQILGQGPTHGTQSHDSRRSAGQGRRPVHVLAGHLQGQVVAVGGGLPTWTDSTFVAATEVEAEALVHDVGQCWTQSHVGSSERAGAVDAVGDEAESVVVFEIDGRAHHDALASAERNPGGHVLEGHPSGQVQAVEDDIQLLLGRFVPTDAPGTDAVVAVAQPHDAGMDVVEEADVPAGMQPALHALVPARPDHGDHGVQVRLKAGIAIEFERGGVVEEAPIGAQRGLHAEIASVGSPVDFAPFPRCAQSHSVVSELILDAQAGETGRAHWVEQAGHEKRPPLVLPIDRLAPRRITWRDGRSRQQAYPSVDVVV